MKKRYSKVYKYFRKMHKRYLRWKALEKQRSQVSTPFHNGFVVLARKIEYGFMASLLCTVFMFMISFMFVAFC